MKAMGELASGLAHEISQPLTAIQATAEACRSLLEAGRTDPDRLSDAMEQITLQSRRASDIIQELRSFVRKGSRSRFPITIRSFSLPISYPCSPTNLRRPMLPSR